MFNLVQDQGSLWSIVQVLYTYLGILVCFNQDSFQ